MSDFFRMEDRTCAKCGRQWEALAFWDADMECHDCGRIEYAAHLTAINAERAYRVDSIGGACPTQAEGTWHDGQVFYFRARHGHWALWVDPEDAVGAVDDPIASGDDLSNGWMDDADVLAILDAAAADGAA